MIRIAICDDEYQVVQSTKRSLKTILDQHDIQPYELREFYRSKELIESGFDCQIAILDIEMPEGDGFILAEYLNKQSDKVWIIYLSGYTNHMQRAFLVKAFRFLSKPLQERQLEEAVLSAYQEFTSHHSIVLNTSNSFEQIIVKKGEVLYIEVLEDLLKIETTRGVFYDARRLKEIKDMLPTADFFQNHRKFIVNLEHVIKINKDLGELLLTNGKSIPLAVRRQNELTSALHKFIKHRGKGI